MRESSLLRSFPGPHFPSLSSFLLPFGPGYSILQPQRSSKILQSGRASGRKSGVRRKEGGGEGERKRHFHHFLERKQTNCKPACRPGRLRGSHKLRSRINDNNSNDDISATAATAATTTTATSSTAQENCSGYSTQYGCYLQFL